MFSAITCDRAHANCFCSHKEANACDAVKNSQCDVQSNQCRCNPGFKINSNGECLIIRGKFNKNRKAHERLSP